MRSRTGRAFTRLWGRGEAPDRRQAGRLGLVLEVLESRLLMAGSPSVRPELARGLERLALASAPSAHVALIPAVGAAPADPEAPHDGEAPGLHVLPGLVEGSYEIVSETQAPHANLSDAQRVPDAQFVGVLGRLNLGDTIDLYRVVVTPGTLALHLASAIDRPSQAPSLRLWVFDALGNVLARISSPDGAADLALDPARSGLPLGSTLYVGVSPMDAQESGPAAGYQLWFLSRLDPDVMSLASAGGSSDLAGTESSGVLLVNPTTVITPASPSSTSPAAVAGGASGLGPALPASAPFPTLAAAPAGGILGDGPATRLVAPRSTSEGEAGWSEVRELATLDVASDEVDVTRDVEASPLVALQGPGGFPLLLAATIGDWRGAAGIDANEHAVADAEDPPTASPDPAQPSSPMGCLSLEAGAPLVAVSEAQEPLPGDADDLGDQPGLKAAVAVTVYVVALDRTPLHDLRDTRPRLAQRPPRSRDEKPPGRRK